MYPDGMQAPPSFVISDANGEEHTYIVPLHPALEGDRLAWRIQGMGVAPLMEALRAFAGTAEALDVEVGAHIGGETILKVLAKSDVTSMSAAMAAMLDKIADRPEIAREAMRYASRDGQSLRDDANWATAYRGNYGEMMEAVVRVVVLNDFFPVARLFRGSSTPTDQG